MAISKPLLLVGPCASIIWIAIITARPRRINTNHLIATIAIHRSFFPSTRPALAPCQAKKGSATITTTAANARSILAVAPPGPSLGRFPPAFASQRARAHSLLSLPTRPDPVPQLRRAPRYPAKNRNPPSPARAPARPPQHRHHRRQHASSFLHLHTPILPAHIRTSRSCSIVPHRSNQHHRSRLQCSHLHHHHIHPSTRSIQGQRLGNAQIMGPNPRPQRPSF